MSFKASLPEVLVEQVDNGYYQPFRSSISNDNPESYKRVLADAFDLTRGSNYQKSCNCKSLGFLSCRCSWGSINSTRISSISDSNAPLQNPFSILPSISSISSANSAASSSAADVPINPISLPSSSASTTTLPKGIRPVFVQSNFTPVSEDSNERIQVLLRIRPALRSEEDSQIKFDVIGDRVVQLQAPEGSVQFKNYVAMQSAVPRSLHSSSTITYEFAFSRVLDQSIGQRELYLSSVGPQLSRFHLDASNSLVFCYGVTNSGKSYTLFGEKTQPGLVPRALYDIYLNISESNAASEQSPLASFLFKPKTFVEAVMLKPKELEADKKIKSQMLDETKSDMPEIAQLAAELGRDRQISRILLATGGLQSHSTDGLVDATGGSREPSAGPLGDASASSFTTAPESNSDADEHNSLGLCAAAAPASERCGTYRYTLWLSYAELYNDAFYDLLDVTPRSSTLRRKALDLRSEQDGQVYLHGLRSVHASTFEEAMRIVSYGHRNLQVASTRLNSSSSRSHSVLYIRLVKSSLTNGNSSVAIKIHVLAFCDLAGAERADKSQSFGTRLREAGTINTGLFTLGKCIEVIRSNQFEPDRSKQRPIPFRDSKLTRLFQNYLVAAHPQLPPPRMLMISNLSPSATTFDESYNVLRFSSRSQQVIIRTVEPDPELAKGKTVNSDAPTVRRLSLSEFDSLSQFNPDLEIANCAKQSIASTASSKASLRNQPIQEESDESDSEANEPPTSVVRVAMATVSNVATIASQAAASDVLDEDTLRPEEPVEKPAPSNKNEQPPTKPLTRLRAAAASTVSDAQKKTALTGKSKVDQPQASIKTAASSWALNIKPKVGAATSANALNIQAEQSKSTAPPAAIAEKAAPDDANSGNEAERPKKKAAFRFAKLPRVALLANAASNREPATSGATSGAAATSRPAGKDFSRQTRVAAVSQQQPSMAANSKRAPIVTLPTAPSLAPENLGAKEAAPSTDEPAGAQAQVDEPSHVKELRAEVLSLREQLAAQKVGEKEMEIKLRTDLANQFQQVFKDQYAQNMQFQEARNEQLERFHEKQMENVEKTARRLVQQSARKRLRMADSAAAGSATAPEDMEIEDLDVLKPRANVVKAPRTLLPQPNPNWLQHDSSDDAVRHIDFSDEPTERFPAPANVEEQLRDENARLQTEVSDLKAQNLELSRAIDQKQQQLITVEFENVTLRGQLRTLQERLDKLDMGPPSVPLDSENAATANAKETRSSGRRGALSAHIETPCRLGYRQLKSVVNETLDESPSAADHSL